MSSNKRVMISRNVSPNFDSKSLIEQSNDRTIFSGHVCLQKNMSSCPSPFSSPGQLSTPKPRYDFFRSSCSNTDAKPFPQYTGSASREQPYPEPQTEPQPEARPEFFRPDFTTSHENQPCVQHHQAESSREHQPWVTSHHAENATPATAYHSQHGPNCGNCTAFQPLQQQQQTGRRIFQPSIREMCMGLGGGASDCMLCCLDICDDQQVLTPSKKCKRNPCEYTGTLTDPKSIFESQVICQPTLIVTLTHTCNMLVYRNNIIKHRSRIENSGGSFIGFSKCVLPSSPTVMGKLFNPAGGVGLVKFNNGLNAVYFTEEMSGYKKILDLNHSSTTFMALMSRSERSLEGYDKWFILGLYDSNHFDAESMTKAMGNHGNVESYGGIVAVSTCVILGVNGPTTPKYVVAITWNNCNQFCCWFAAEEAQNWITCISRFGQCEYILTQISQNIRNC